MSKRFEVLRGMDDILPGEIEKWQWLEEKARVFFEVSGYREIRTPLLELTALFSRSIGETSDIVHKEMYSFEDRGGRQITLRPEMTASVARAVIEKGLLKQTKSLALFYTGPMFRAERPQAGRKRQFHQIGAELVNEQGMAADCRLIATLIDFLQYLKIKNIRLKMNDLTLINGPEAASIREKLKSYFEAHKAKLDPDSLYRLENNVLRIFDSKAEEMQAIIQNAPWQEIAPLSPEFLALAESFKKEGVSVEVNRRLVRGLDYYTGIVFEISLDGLGAQDAVAGGGRYDNLYSELGGSGTPCTGFSIGVERLLMALSQNTPSLNEQLAQETVYLVPLCAGKENAEYKAVTTAAIFLRENGIRVEVGEPGVGFGDHLRKANKVGAGYVLVKGEEEIKKKVWTLKQMARKEQSVVEEGKLFETLLSEMRGKRIL